jgi:hypothetical protein
MELLPEEKAELLMHEEADKEWKYRKDVVDRIFRTNVSKIKYLEFS